MQIGFETLELGLPEEILDVETHFAYLEEKIGEMTEREQTLLNGATPKYVRRLRDPDAAEILALKAARAALSAGSLDVADIDGLLVVQSGGKQFMPLLSSYVHLNLKFRDDILARNIVDDSIGALSAVKLAEAYVRAGKCARVLVIAVASQIGGMTRFGVDLTDPHAKLFGDAAVAGVVSAQNLQFEFIGHSMDTNAVTSRPGGTLIAAMEPVRSPRNPDLIEAAGIDGEPSAFLSSSNDAFDSLAEDQDFVADSIVNACNNAGIQPSALKLIMHGPEQRFASSWKTGLISLGLPEKSIRDSNYQYGNTAVVSPLLNLVTAREEDEFGGGEYLAVWASSPSVQRAVLIVRTLIDTRNRNDGKRE